MKLNVVIVPVKPKYCTAYRRPKPLMAPRIVILSGQLQAVLISSMVKANMLLLRACTDNFDSC